MHLSYLLQYNERKMLFLFNFLFNYSFLELSRNFYVYGIL